MVPIQSVGFSGVWRGLMRRKRLLDHPHLYAADSKNVELLGNVIAKRRGTKRLSATQLGDGTSRRVHALFQAKWRSGTGTDEVLAAAGALIQSVGDPPGPNLYNLANLPAGSPARTVPTEPVHFSQLDNKVFIVDGTNDLNLKYRYVGGVGIVQKFGIDAPATAPTIGAPFGAGITLAFGRKYRQRFVNSLTQHEGEPGPESVSTGAVANKTIPVQTATSPDPQVDRVRLYSTTDGGGGVWLFVGETTPGAIFNDNVSDSALGTQMEEFVNDPPPARMKLVVPWPSAGRMLGVEASSPSILRFTDLVVGRLKPESWPPGNIVPVAVDMGDDIVAIYPFSDSVLIFCERSIWRMLGFPPDLNLEPVQFHNTRTAIGGFAQSALVQVDDHIVNPFLDGAYTVGRFEDLKGGFTTSRISRAIDDLWGELNAAAVQNTHAIFLRNRKQIRIWLPHGAIAEPRRCLVLQLDTSVDGEGLSWGLWEHLAAAGTPAQITASLVVQTASGDAAYTGTSDGYILQLDQGFEDSWSGVSPGNGVAYEFLWETVPFALHDAEQDVRLRFVDLVIRPETPCSVVMVPRTDMLEDWPSVPFSVAPTSSFILGQSFLDTGKLGGVATFLVRASLLTRGVYHSLRYRNDEKGASFAIEKWRVRWQPLALKARDVGVAQVVPGYVIPANEYGPGFGDDGFGGGEFL